MQLRWLRRALENLEDEAAYVAKDSPKLASELVTHLFGAVAMLAKQPHLGRPGRIPGTRELVMTRFSYVIPYRVRGEVVEVLRVFHTARKWPKRFS